ncbi:MAG: UvrB/UvrC motif-containing protein [Rhodothermia bacterium]
MECQDCGLRDANLQVTTIVDGEMRTLHLCGECASKRGLPAEGPTEPLAGFLAQLGPDAPESGERSEPCPYCGITGSEFRQTGRLGCSQCYVHFEPQIRGLLRRLHGSAQHVGKLYMSVGSEAGDRVAQMSAMRRRLKRAVETEDFELAAELRDRIHQAESSE